MAGTPKLPEGRPEKGERAEQMRPEKVRHGPPEVTGVKRAAQNWRPKGGKSDGFVEVYEMDEVTEDVHDEDGNVIGTRQRTPYAVVYDDVPDDENVGAVVWVAHDLDHLKRAWGAIPLPADVYDAMLEELGIERGPLNPEPEAEREA